MSAIRGSLAIVAVYFVCLCFTHKNAALTDDDDYYIPAGISYVAWLGKAVTFQPEAFKKKTIDAAYKINKEHPPFAKYVFGLSHFSLRGVLGPSDSARFGAILFSSLIVALLCFLAVFHFGTKSGLRIAAFSSLMLLALPRFNLHSHVATLDVPVAAMYLFAATMVLYAERSKRAAIWAGPVFGLATATKLNAPFLLLAYIPFIIFTRVSELRNSPSSPRPATIPSGLRLIPFPAALLSMATLGPLVFFAIWPWMWTDTVARVKEYIAFHANHYGIHFLYFGQVHTDAPYAPWHAPFVMAASTIPLVTSAFAVFAVIRAWPLIQSRLTKSSQVDEKQRMRSDLLLFLILNSLTTISLVAFAGTPIYGGEKLFMPFFPFWCLLAGIGVNHLYEALQSVVRNKTLKLALVTLFCSSGFFYQWRYFGYELSQYNALVGGVRGATALGFERQYYDLAHRDLVDWLSENGPKNLKVHFLPNNWEYVRTYKWYRRGKDLRSDIVVVNNERAADWIIITHERRFARYSKDLSRYRSKPVLFEKRIDSTPIWTVFSAKTIDNPR
ncbi:MAG: glycosyltransferase family 39 protein [Myxococcota bacterium]|nr:glycosyltransferase family 39 protein [Myxococcota bacterium]